jgi:hypothetical protein
MRDLNRPSRSGTATSRDATRRDKRRNKDARSRDPTICGGVRVQWHDELSGNLSLVQELFVVEKLSRLLYPPTMPRAGAEGAMSRYMRIIGDTLRSHGRLGEHVKAWELIRLQRR